LRDTILLRYRAENRYLMKSIFDSKNGAVMFSQYPLEM